MRRRRRGDGEEAEGTVYHLPDISYVGPKLDVPEPPDDLPYAQRDDYRSAQLLEINGIDATDEGLLDALRSQQVILLAAAAHTAGSRSVAAAEPALREIAARQDGQASVEAAYALARLGHDDAVTFLHDAARLPVEASLAPVLAAGFLARLGDPSGYPAVREGLDSEFLATRMLACKQLYVFWPLRDRVDVQALFQRALDDRERSVQGEALVQLADLRAPETARLLERFLDRSRDAYLRKFASEALASLG